jgi:hypothetical protein
MNIKIRLISVPKPVLPGAQENKQRLYILPAQAKLFKLCVFFYCRNCPIA